VTSSLAVTGASGYLGSRIVAVASAGGDAPVALVRARTPYVASDRQVELDLAEDRDGLIAALAGAGSVIHLAGLNEHVAASEPDRALTQTVLASQNLAAAAAAAGVRRLVYLSTVHVYGRRMVADAVLDEDTPPAPTSTYAIARLASEHLVAQATDAGVDVVVLRLTNSVGAPLAVDVDRWSLAGPDLCRQAITTGEMVLRSSGLQWRDFIAVTDVCDAVLRTADPSGGIAPGTYNLGTGIPMTVRDLAELIGDRFEARTGSRPPLRTAPPEPDPPRAYRVDVDRLAKAGWRASATIADAVDELVAFCLDHADDLR
jgi:UDP-glucose 4-epimerase